MVKLLTLIIRLLLVLSIARARVVVLDDAQKKTHDEMCGPMVEMLCVKDSLYELVEAAKVVQKLAAKIEKTTLRHELNALSVSKSIDGTIAMIHASLPTSEYHNRSFLANNLNKSDLIRVLQEENYAVSYFYNSVKYVRHMENYFVQSVDDFYEDIEQILRKKFLCSYRNILHVYSERWQHASAVHHIPFSNIHRKESRSFAYNTHSIILVRLLRGWMESIEDFIRNLETKLI